VLRDKLTAVRLRNAAGKDVAASEAGFSVAIRESDLHKNGDDLASILNQAGDTSWPITLTTFVLFDAAPSKAETVDAKLSTRFTLVKPQVLHAELLSGRPEQRAGRAARGRLRDPS
jgi:hypothetical protein